MNLEELSISWNRLEVAARKMHEARRNWVAADKALKQAQELAREAREASYQAESWYVREAYDHAKLFEFADINPDGDSLAEGIARGDMST